MENLSTSLRLLGSLPASSVMKTINLFLIFATSFLSCQIARAQQSLPLSHSDLEHLLGIIKPQENESPWREINWITNITEARQRAIAEDKPLVIFTAADGSPIGRT